MRPTLRDAVEVLQRRREAVGNGEPPSFIDALEGKLNDIGPLLLAGTDLNPAELEEIARDRAQGAMFSYAVAAARGQLPYAIAGTWLDGLLVGLILADLRAQAD